MTLPILSSAWINEIADNVIQQALGYLDSIFFEGLLREGILPFEQSLQSGMMTPEQINTMALTEPEPIQRALLEQQVAGLAKEAVSVV